MLKNKIGIAVVFVLTTMILGSAPPQALHDMIIPLNVVSSTETISFDEIGTHESRQSLVGSSPIVLIETDDLGVLDKAACLGIRAVHSAWNCVGYDIPGWDHAYLSFEEYTFDAEVVYYYNIRHFGDVELDISTTRQGNNAPVMDIEVISSNDAYEVEVKAVVEFTIKRVYKGDNGYQNIVRNEFTYQVPFPSLVDVDGDNSYKMLGNIKIYTWDNFADLSNLSSVQTHTLGSREDLSDNINLVKIDLLALAAKYTSSPTLRAINSFLYVNFDVDLDIEFYLQSAVMPFVGTEGSTQLSNVYKNSNDRITYPCKLALIDQISRNPVLTNNCLRTLPQDSTGATIQLGLWHEYYSKESYSAHIRVGPQNNFLAKTAWNILTNVNYFQFTLIQGKFPTSAISQDTNLVRSDSVDVGIPSPITVVANQDPVAVLAVTPTSALEDTIITATTASTYDPDSDSYEVQVRWGDGTQSPWTTSGGQINHQYSEPGTYVVSLEVRDQKGAANTVSKVVTITPKPVSLTSYLTATESKLVESEATTFSWGSSNSGPTVNYNLSFGDGSYYNGPSSITSTNHTYSEPGQYNALLIVSSNGNVQTKSLTIIVEPDYSSSNVVVSNYSIKGNQTLVIIDDNEAELYVTSGQNASSAPMSSRDALFRALNTAAVITNSDWDIYFVENGTGSSSDYNNESGPGLNFLEDYSTIIWSTGNHWYPLTDTDVDNLETYTGAGGTLIMFSQDMLYGAGNYFNSTNQFNTTFSISNTSQDVGLGTFLSAANGYNVAYTPLAGLHTITTRSVSDNENQTWSVAFADSVYTWDGNPYALGQINATMINSSTGNHAILSLEDDKRIAYFAFDPVQIASSYDLEAMMLGLLEWGSDSTIGTYRVENSTYLSTGVDGFATLGPWNQGAIGSTTRTEELTHIYDIYVVEGHDYNFSIGGNTYIDFNSGGYELFSDYFSYCWDGPIADVSFEDESGNTITSLNPYCDWNTGEWSLEWTANISQKLTVRVVSEDLYSNSTWSYYVPISFKELYDINYYSTFGQNYSNCDTILVGSIETDVIHPFDSYNHQDYSNSCFEMNITSGSYYAISLDRGLNNPSNITIKPANFSLEDIQYATEQISGEAVSGEMIFYAYNSTSFTFVVESDGYVNPLVADGNYDLYVWEINSSQPVDDYLNASEISPTNYTNSGYVDYTLDSGDWWSIPVSQGESYELEINVDSDEYFGVMAYFHSRDDPYNYTVTPYINDTFYGTTTLELSNLSFGEIKLLIYASSDESTWTGSRGNYTIGVNKLDRILPVNEIIFADIGFASIEDTYDVFLFEDTPYVIRLNSSPSMIAGSKVGDQLSMNIVTPSGNNISSYYSDSINNNTLTIIPTETGLYRLNVYGINGSYWVWTLVDDGAVFDTYPQRYATAELPFTDHVHGTQLIESELYYYHLTTYQDYYLENGPQGFVLDSLTGNISYNPTRSDVGTHFVSIRIDNSWGSSTWQNYSLVVADLPNTAPVISSVQNLTTTVGYQHTTYVSANDIDNDTLTYSLVSSPVGASIDSITGQISWISTSIGQYSFEVMVTDDRGLSSSMNFNVASENSAPVISAVSNAITNVGSQYNYQVSAVDNDGHNILWGLQSGPAGLSMDVNGYISWNAQTGQVGTHTVIVEVTDEYGENSIEYWDIEVPNTSPSVQLNNVPTTMNVNELLSLQSVMQDSDGHQMWLVLVEGPSGMTINSTGAILWMPRADQIGNHQFEVMVIDSFGDSYSVVKDIEVLNIAPDGQFSQMWQDIRTKEVWRVLTLDDTDGHQVEVMCDSSDVSLTLIDNSTILFNWVAESLQDSLTIQCTLTDEYQSTSQIQTNFMFVPLDVSSALAGDSSRTFGENASAEWVLSLPVESIQVNLISGTGIASSYGADQDWQLEYTPGQDEGKVIISLYAITEYGDVFEEIWVINYDFEDNSWSCSLGEFVQQNELWNSQIDCSRNDVNITILQPLTNIIDLEDNLISISNIEYGLTTVDIFLEGPDGTSKFVTKMIYHAKPESTGTFTESIIDVSMETGTLFVGDITYQTSNAEFAYCKATSDLPFKSLINSDCSYVLMFNQSGEYEIEFALYNESNVELDGGKISVSVTEPKTIVTDESESQMPVIYASSGMILALIIGVILSKLIFQRKEENVFSDEQALSENDSSSEKELPSFTGTTNTNLIDSGSTDTISANTHGSIGIPPASTPATSVDDNGYEWLVMSDANWYRIKDSNAEWQIYEN